MEIQKGEPMQESVSETSSAKKEYHAPQLIEQGPWTQHTQAPVGGSI